MTNMTNINTPHTHPLRNAVDQLALIKAQIAELKAQEESLRAVLINSGLSAVDSDLHRATVSECDGKEMVDWKSIALKFSPSRQLVTAHTSKGDPYFQVRVFARKS